MTVAVIKPQPITTRDSSNKMPLTEIQSDSGTGDTTHSTWRKVIKLIRERPLPFSYAAFRKWALSELANVPYGSGAGKYVPGYAALCLVEMNCVTFVEQFMALALTALAADSLPKPTTAVSDSAYTLDSLRYDSLIFNTFADNVYRLRYYPATVYDNDHRLHYFTAALLEWEKMGLMKNVAADSGTKDLRRIHFMSSHPRYYRIRDWNYIRKTEQRLSNSRRYYFPLSQYETCRRLAQDGDIVALAAATPGLDVSHVGLLSKDSTGKLLFTHASQVKMELTIEEDLAAYLAARNEGKVRVIGLYVYRPVFETAKKQINDNIAE
jgi:hypothetical protein